MQKKVAVFGEMLWDCLPSGAVPGGASMNVALNLHQLGIDALLISAVGADEDGEKLLEFIKSFDLASPSVQVKKNYKTSRVLVDDSDKENMKYNIVSPVAWDFIQWDEITDRKVLQSDALIFGTLGVRNHFSLETLLGYLKHPVLRVFDSNLRPPNYDFEVIEKLLGFTDILKINEDELEVFAHYFQTKPTVDGLCGYLDQHFPIELICVTLGAKGALIYNKGNVITHPGFKVKLQDSIGAGDAFLSGFVKSYLDKKPLTETLELACKVGSFVASQKGGAPRYSEKSIFNL